MRQLLIPAVIPVLLMLSMAASAEQGHGMHHHHMALQADNRQVVVFPAAMKQANLASMRNHLMVISEVLVNLGKGDFQEAARVADAGLGLNSPSAAGCKPVEPGDKPQMSAAPSMDAMMAKLMPPEMMRIGLAMHQAASDFALEAAKPATAQNPARAYAALGKVTQQCTNCHSSYRLQ